MESILEWLASLPHWALYSAMGVLAAVENVFPPIPADSIVALGSFLAARGQGSATIAFFVVWIGNVLGAMGMYLAGRHFGADFLERWLRRSRTPSDGEQKLVALYQRYGLLALAASRFIPAVRAVVPPFAGALRIPSIRMLLVLAIPSGIWYGFVTLVAFHFGENLERTLSFIASTQIWLLAAAAVILLGVGVTWHRYRTRRDRE